jgi:hypothetical protein
MKQLSAAIVALQEAQLGAGSFRRRGSASGFPLTTLPLRSIALSSIDELWIETDILRAVPMSALPLIVLQNSR